MIYIDDREYNCEKLIKKFPAGMAEIKRLEYGDFAFWGKGWKDEGPVWVGVERKKIRDLINSITKGRLAGKQLPGIVKNYDQAWLVVEGEGRYHGEGQVLQDRGYVRGGKKGKWSNPTKSYAWRDVSLGRKGFTRSQIQGWLHSAEMMTGVRVWHTRDEKDTVQWLVALHNWWQKHLDGHKSMQAMAQVQLKGGREPKLMEKVTAQLPGIGPERCIEVARKFKNLKALTEATEKDWMEIDGIGKTIAKRMVETVSKGG